MELHWLNVVNRKVPSWSTLFFIVLLATTDDDSGDQPTLASNQQRRPGWLPLVIVRYQLPGRGHIVPNWTLQFFVNINSGQSKIFFLH